jgi:hypothetical protein
VLVGTHVGRSTAVATVPPSFVETQEVCWIRLVEKPLGVASVVEDKMAGVASVVEDQTACDLVVEDKARKPCGCVASLVETWRLAALAFVLTLLLHVLPFLPLPTQQTCCRGCFPIYATDCPLAAFLDDVRTKTHCQG